MPDPRECPMCGEMMRLKHIEAVVQVPGNPTPNKRTIREWICPECEYFEEAEND